MGWRSIRKEESQSPGPSFSERKKVYQIAMPFIWKDDGSKARLASNWIEEKKINLKVLPAISSNWSQSDGFAVYEPRRLIVICCTACKVPIITNKYNFLDVVHVLCRLIWIAGTVQFMYIFYVKQYVQYLCIFTRHRSMHNCTFIVSSVW